MKIAADQFTWDDYFWKTEVILPSWKGFQSRAGPYRSFDPSQPSDGTVNLVFAPEGRGAEPLTRSELVLIQWLLDHERQVADAILPALAEEYPKLQDQYGYSPEERAECMPDLESVEDLRRLVGLHSVHVHQVSKAGMPYVGLEFGCSWDDEHGLGVLVHGDRVVEIGGADTAILLWIAVRDGGR